MENTTVFTENFEIESRKVEFGMVSDPEIFMIDEPVDVAEVLILDPFDTANVLPF